LGGNPTNCSPSTDNFGKEKGGLRRSLLKRSIKKGEEKDKGGAGTPKQKGLYYWKKQEVPKEC